ncbi:MAG TPA: methyltransferase domain-containing protein [Terriglobales bacterium]|nr:methyltransferase domain-containing protein [Terriglobales bacterium]
MLLRSIKLTFLTLVATLCAYSFAQAPAHRPTSTPYTGDLSIFDTPGRAERLQVNRVMDTLGIFPGKRVADIGAGSGFFSVLAARRVGDKGIVYAEDINPEAIHYIDARVKKDNLHNVKTVLGKPNNPLLPGPVDAVLLLKAYHEVAQPVVLFRNLRHSLAKDAKVGVIDRNGNGANHGVNRDVVIREMKQAGYKVVQQEDYKKDGMDYFLVFAAE